MPLEFGLRTGLSADFGANNEINDLRYREAVKRQALTEAANKAKMFADDLDYTNGAMNPFDNPRVKQFSQFQIKRIGQFVNQNPDWETNLDKRAQYKQLTHDLKDNTDLRRGMASDAAFKQLDADLAEKSKHPELFDQEAYKHVLQQRDNYLKYGHQDGEEAALREGPKAFLYQQPQDKVDFNKLAADGGAKLAETFKTGPNGSVIGSVPADASALEAKNLYQMNPAQADREARANGFASGADYLAKLVDIHAKKSMTQGFNPNSNVGFANLQQKLPYVTHHIENDKQTFQFELPADSAEKAVVEIPDPRKPGQKINVKLDQAIVDNKTGQLKGKATVVLSPEQVEKNKEIIKSNQDKETLYQQAAADYQALFDKAHSPDATAADKKLWQDTPNPAIIKIQGNRGVGPKMYTPQPLEKPETIDLDDKRTREIAFDKYHVDLSNPAKNTNYNQVDARTNSTMTGKSKSGKDIYSTDGGKTWNYK